MILCNFCFSVSLVAGTNLAVAMDASAAEGVLTSLVVVPPPRQAPASPNPFDPYSTHAFSPSPPQNEEDARIGQAIQDILDQDEMPASQVATAQNKGRFTYRLENGMYPER